jgi:hypothetical protein
MWCNGSQMKRTESWELVAKKDQKVISVVWYTWIETVLSGTTSWVHQYERD